MNMKAYRMIVRGIVQGVGFRYYTYRLAKRYGVKGYVMNMPDGSVQIVAECGDEAKLNEFLMETARGPSTAVVEGVEKEEIPPSGFRSFEIRYHI